MIGRPLATFPEKSPSVGGGVAKLSAEVFCRHCCFATSMINQISTSQMNLAVDI